MSLISISIDISNSTAIKRRIAEFSSGDSENITDLYKQFCQRLGHMEMTFYAFLLDHGATIDKVFAVKSLGDEVWVVYDVADLPARSLEYNALLNIVFSALIALQTKSFSMAFPQRRLTEEEEVNFELQRNVSFETAKLVPKVFVDRIDTWVDLNEIRFDVFGRRCGELLGLGKRICLDDLVRRYPEYVDKLNFGKHMRAEGTKHSVACRTDPMGYEVDLFFRCTKAALPGLIGVGDRLFRSIRQEEDISIPPDSRCEDYPVVEGCSNSKRHKRYRCACRRMCSGCLKGVREHYDI